MLRDRPGESWDGRTEEERQEAFMWRVRRPIVRQTEKRESEGEVGRRRPRTRPATWKVRDRRLRAHDKKDYKVKRRGSGDAIDF